MFNGIIFYQAKVKKIAKREKGINLFLESSIKLSKKDLGISISCDGVCLTLLSYKKKLLEFYLSNETLIKTKFKKVKLNDLINLEFPMRYGESISGHICQGHVDTIGIVKKIKKIDKSYCFDFLISKNFIKYFVEKASILINGVSLTISKVKKNSFECWVIPHTFNVTNISSLKKKDLVNIEIDILSKYVKKFIYAKK